MKGKSFDFNPAISAVLFKIREKLSVTYFFKLLANAANNRDIFIIVHQTKILFFIGTLSFFYESETGEKSYILSNRR